ncbi:hypothetical protein DY000_02016020 [Brassica cretica]|uniref:Uncharacterized protein n=1 Tax=Brassica cretica TaxID=69181 RepID=A0ABQ7DCK4_BRACR|nr:hypothetical protein DY000_02016020 [Brassica cretica]
MTHRSLSYSGLDEIDTGLQRPRSTPIQFQNRSTERQGDPRTLIPPPYHSISEKRTPSATRTFHQAGFDNLTEQARRHDLRGPSHSTEECRAALLNQNENKKTTEEAREEEEEPVTPKSNRKDKFPTNKIGREIEQESPSSPPPAPKKRVDMILWGLNNNATDEIKSHTEGKIRFEITIAIRTLEKTDAATSLPGVTQWLALDRGSIKSHSASLDDPFNPYQFQKCRLPSRILFLVGSGLFIYSLVIATY